MPHLVILLLTHLRSEIRAKSNAEKPKERLVNLRVCTNVCGSQHLMSDLQQQFFLHRNLCLVVYMYPICGSLFFTMGGKKSNDK